ncbi:unnamed protein product [Natator depressus]
MSLSITLGHKQRQQTQELCTSFTPVFSATPGRTERAYHSIDSGDARPIRAQPYRMAPQAKTAIKREIKDMLQMGVIRPSESPWASPVLLVPKPDGEIQFCVDYRKLNAVTHPDNYPMPHTDELLEKLGRAQFISTLDLTKGVGSQGGFPPNQTVNSHSLSLSGRGQTKLTPPPSRGGVEQEVQRAGPLAQSGQHQGGRQTQAAGCSLQTLLLSQGRPWARRNLIWRKDWGYQDCQPPSTRRNWRNQAVTRASVSHRLLPALPLPEGRATDSCRRSPCLRGAPQTLAGAPPA